MSYRKRRLLCLFMTLQQDASKVSFIILDILLELLFYSESNGVIFN